MTASWTELGYKFAQILKFQYKWTMLMNGLEKFEKLLCKQVSVLQPFTSRLLIMVKISQIGYND